MAVPKILHMLFSQEEKRGLFFVNEMPNKLSQLARRNKIRASLAIPCMAPSTQMFCKNLA